MKLIYVLYKIINIDYNCNLIKLVVCLFVCVLFFHHYY